MLIGMYGKVQFETIRCYLLGMNVYSVHTKILTCAAILHFLAAYFFIVKMNTGLIGGAATTSGAYLCSLLLIAIYIKKKRFVMFHPNVWHRFNEDSLKSLGTYISQGYPSAILRSFETGGYKISLIYVCWIGRMELATYVITAALTSLTLQIALGIGTGAHNLIHNAMVHFHWNKAKRYANIAIAGGLLCGIVS